MRKPKLSITGVVSSTCGYPDDCHEPQIFYQGQWRKLGDRVHYEHAKGWRKWFKFPIIYIAQGAAQLLLPKWYGWSYGWTDTKGGVKATIIGNTIEPKEAIPAWMKTIL